MTTAVAEAHGAPHTNEECEPAVPISNGKLAMWLFLATEIMFFTGLIGSYIVLRIGSPRWVTPDSIEIRVHQTDKTVKVVKAELVDEGKDEGKSEITFEPWEGQWKGDKLPQVATVAIPGSKKEAFKITKADAEPCAENEGKIYDKQDPLALGLTAFNTFVLICSSVTMVLALSAIERGDQAKLKLFLLATVLIGAFFLSIQFYEYRKLISEGFVPSKNIFASCFYVMTGCHGAHVTGGVLYLIGILIAAASGKFTRRNHSAVEIAGLYWHFVDLVWILLFTVVYLI